MDVLPTEAFFDAHEEVARSALVAVGEGESLRAALVVQSNVELSADEQARLGSELRARARSKRLPIQVVLFHEDIPMDLRHDARILRKPLAAWAHAQT